MGLMFAGRESRTIPWIVSQIRPHWRFFGMRDGERVLATSDDTVSFCLRRSYESDLRAELVDPEWPCEYWEYMLELMEAGI